MSYTLKFDHPQFPYEQDFGIPNLGIVKNGGTLELDEDAERLFIAERGMSVEDAFKDNSMVTLTGSSSISADELVSLLPEVEPDVDSSDLSSNSGDSNTGGSVFDQVDTSPHESGDN